MKKVGGPHVARGGGRTKVAQSRPGFHVFSVGRNMLPRPKYYSMLRRGPSQTPDEKKQCVGREVQLSAAASDDYHAPG